MDSTADKDEQSLCFIVINYIFNASIMFDPSDFNLPSLITHAWTEKTILDKLKENGLKIESKLVQFSPLRRIDHLHSGQTSIPIKIQLKWHFPHTALPNSLVVKQFTLQKVDQPGTDMEDQETMIRVHNNECQFYQSILPGISGLLVPKCYHAQECISTDNISGFLLFEDLSAGVSVDQYQEFTLHQVHAITDSIARLQAHGLKHDLSTSHENVDVKHWTLDTTRRISFFNAIKERYPDEFSDILLDDIKKLDNGESYHKTFYGETPFPVLVHGDIWTNNIIWKADNGKAADTHLAIIDWQAGHVGNPAEDLSRLLVLHLSADVRREHEVGILHRYYDQLSLLLEHNVAFDFEYVWSWYRKSLVSQSMIACMNHMLKPWVTTKEPSETLQDAKRVSEAIRDSLKHIDSV